MRGRITFWVTCVCLVCCIAFTALHASATLTQLNRSATDDLLRICRMSAEYLDNAAFSPSEEKEAITRLANELDIKMNVIDETGAFVAGTRITASANMLSDEEINEALVSEEGVGLAYRMERDGQAMFAACRLEDGGVVRVWHEAPTVWMVLGSMTSAPFSRIFST